jgi:hypothetical protein
VKELVELSQTVNAFVPKEMKMGVGDSVTVNPDKGEKKR